MESGPTTRLIGWSLLGLHQPAALIVSVIERRLALESGGSFATRRDAEDLRSCKAQVTLHDT